MTRLSVALLYRVSDTVMNECGIFLGCLQVKGKGKIHPRTGYEGPERV
jgi:hypothetical protein